MILKYSIIFILICFIYLLLKPIKKLYILHIGKTAGRAIKTSTRNNKRIHVTKHKIKARHFKNRHRNVKIAAVIRDPVDRVLSAIYWFKQKGENGEMKNHTCHKFVKDKNLTEILSDFDEFDKKCIVKRNPAFVPTKKYIENYEEEIIPICFNKLEEDFRLKIKPYCDNKCTLKSRNKSKRPKIEELTKEESKLVKSYVNSRYKDDIEYYNKKCLN